MPERVVRIADTVSSIATSNIDQIERMTSATKVLALNALIEAARAGQHGAGFAVVAREMGGVADQIRDVSRELSDQLTPCVQDLGALGKSLVEQVRGQRLVDLSLHAVELIDRNLYERSCDVRWWATDAAIVDACVEPDDADRSAWASKRLGVILDSYTVYLDLWVADRSGRVVAHGRPDRYPGVVGADVSTCSWFRHAVQTRDGTEFAVDDIGTLPLLGDAPVATYSTAVRAGGETNGDVVGALGIFFDWGPQAQAIVEGIRLSDEERHRTRCMLLAADGTVIASSDGQGVLTDRFDLKIDDRESGYYTDASGDVVGFALTPGYETYEGLGWYGAIVQGAVRADDA